MHGCHLPARLDRVVLVVVTPPIPAAIRIGEGRMGFRIENDDAIAVGPMAIAGRGSEPIADERRGLFAAVKGDVHAAGGAGGAIGRNVNEAGFVQTMVRGIGQELCLIEFNQLAARCSDSRIERAVDVPKKVACLIIVAVIDEGAAGAAAACTLVIGDEGMTRSPIIDIADRAIRQAGKAVEGSGLIDHRLRHRAVFGAGEDVDPVIGEIGQRIDPALPLTFARSAQKQLGIGRAEMGLHALIERQREMPIRAAIRTTSDNACPHQAAGERDVKLPRHIGA